MADAAHNSDERLRKYQETLRGLEHDERLLRAREQVLRWLVGRLCLAAHGQSPRLDAALNKLKNSVIKGQVEIDQLETMGNEIAGAVRELDAGAPTLDKHDATITGRSGAARNAAAPALPGEAVLGDEKVRAVLSRLLSELRSEPKLAEGIADIDRELAVSLTREQLPQIVERIGGLLVQRIHGLERAREELQQLLDQMVAQLDVLSLFVAGHDLDQSERRASNETLKTPITGEMKALGDTVDTGSDLMTIRRQLRTRLDYIGRHL